MFSSPFNHCNYNDWVLVFEDEFNGHAIDLSTWCLRPWGEGAMYGFGKEQEYNTLDNVVVENGIMKIVALQDAIFRRAISYMPDSEILPDGLPNLRPYYFTSSNIWSKKEYSFGRFEAKIKIPKGKGLWPAFWLFGNEVRWNEIDIFEFWNESVAGIYTPNLLSKIINMTVHDDYDGDGETNKCQISYTGEDYSNDFHIYALEWEPNRIAWYVDGLLIREDYHYYNLLGQPADCAISALTPYTANKIYPVNPMHVIFNLAIQAGADNQPDSPNIFPAYMDIDWIRYYKRNSYSDVLVADSTMYPLNHLTYNSITGNTISIDCPYTIHQGNQLYVVSATEVMLSSGFYVEEGGTFVAKINENTNSKNTDTTTLIKKKTINNIESDYTTPNVYIYPTMNQGFINIDVAPTFSFTELKVTVFNMLGNKILFQTLCEGKNYGINISNFPDGIYIVQVATSQGEILKTEKIIIAK